MRLFGDVIEINKSLSLEMGKKKKKSKLVLCVLVWNNDKYFKWKNLR